MEVMEAASLPEFSGPDHPAAGAAPTSAASAQTVRVLAPSAVGAAGTAAGAALPLTAGPGMRRSIAPAACAGFAPFAPFEPPPLPAPLRAGPTSLAAVAADPFHDDWPYW